MDRDYSLIDTNYTMVLFPLPTNGNRRQNRPSTKWYVPDAEGFNPFLTRRHGEIPDDVSAKSGKKMSFQFPSNGKVEANTQKLLKIGSQKKVLFPSSSNRKAYPKKKITAP